MIESLAERLKLEMTAAGTVCATPVLMGAWTRKPEGYS
jgi:hypothetical protein